MRLARLRLCTRLQRSLYTSRRSASRRHAASASSLSLDPPPCATSPQLSSSSLQPPPLLAPPRHVPSPPPDSLSLGPPRVRELSRHDPSRSPSPASLQHVASPPTGPSASASPPLSASPSRDQRQPGDSPLAAPNDRIQVTVVQLRSRMWELVAFRGQDLSCAGAAGMHVFGPDVCAEPLDPIRDLVRGERAAAEALANVFGLHDSAEAYLRRRGTRAPRRRPAAIVQAANGKSRSLPALSIRSVCPMPHGW